MSQGGRTAARTSQSSKINKKILLFTSVREYNSLTDMSNLTNQLVGFDIFMHLIVQKY
jgi:hypothetical protein